MLMLCLIGCGRNEIKKALDTDANGYLCLACKAKFYTERSVFADVCPQCKNSNIQQVVGFICPIDRHVTIAPRGPGFMPCENCGKTTQSLSIPREAELKSWGAQKKTKTEVTGR